MLSLHSFCHLMTTYSILAAHLELLLLKIQLYLTERMNHKYSLRYTELLRQLHHHLFADGFHCLQSSPNSRIQLLTEHVFLENI